MQGAHTTSTLELVVNEQQMQNMSQVDLSQPGDNNRSSTNQLPNNENFGCGHIRMLPTRFRDSFNAKVDEAKAKSETKTEFVFEVMHAFSGTLIWVLCCIFTIIVPVILFFVGLANLDSCNARPSLPYLVFATGFVMTTSNLFNLALTLDLPILTNHQILTIDIKNIIASITNIWFNCVVAFLYILCAYMVFTIGTGKRHPPVDTSSTPSADATDDPQDDSMDCSGLLYYFTFWFITLTLGLFVLLAIVAIVFFAYNKYRLTIIRGSTPRSQPETLTHAASVYTTNRV